MTTGFIIGAGGGLGEGSGLEICDIGMALYVDETKGLRRYLNGQIVDINTNTQAFLNRLKEITTLHPSLLCTEENWQTAKTSSAFGQVGKFVFNYNGADIVSVRLPRVVNVQGLFDLQNLGMTVAESLPNIQGSVYLGTTANSGNGAISVDKVAGHGSTSGTSTDRVHFNASDYNPTYQDNAHVQQEAIQYPYFIQIATGAETENNIINDIELNNPFSLFDSKYSDHELNNLSWLKSEGQWNAKAVYTDAYDKILENVNNGVDGYKGVGYAYVYNNPTKTVWITAPTPVVGATVYGWDPCHKIGTVESYTDSTITFFNKETNETATATRRADSNLPITSTYWITDYDFVLNTADETFRLPLKTLHSDDTVDSLSLYFYVGETVQNANLIDAGRIGEQLANKADKTEVDGEWVTLQEPASLSASINLNASTPIELDLTNFLPQDNNSYECLISAGLTTGKSSGDYGAVSVFLTNDSTSYINLCGAQTRTSSSVIARGSSSVPVGTDRKIYICRKTAWAGTLEFLNLIAYRRLGKIGV